MAWACKVVSILALTLQLVTIVSSAADDSSNKTPVETTIVAITVDGKTGRPLGGKISGYNNGLYVIKGKDSYTVDRFGRIQDVVPVLLNNAGLSRWWNDILKDVIVNRQYVNYDYRRYERRRDYDRRFDYYYYGRQRPTGVIFANDVLTTSSSSTTTSSTTTTATPPPYAYPFTISYAYSRPYTYPSY